MVHQILELLEHHYLPHHDKAKVKLVELCWDWCSWSQSQSQILNQKQYWECRQVDWEAV